MLSLYTLNPSDFTPVMQQYLNARQKLDHGSLLFFRMGDFYEAFFEDAQLIAKELEITLTGKPEQKFPGGRIPMAGVPAKAIKPYIAKLLESNYKIHVAEQMADPKTCKGLVPREITKVYTPGTINDLDFLETYQNNFILSIFSNDNQSYGLSYADISTGEFYVTEIDSIYLNEELARIKASEIIIPARISKAERGQIVGEKLATINIQANKNYSLFDKNNFDIDLARQNLTSIFEVNSIEKLIHDSLGSSDGQGLALIAAGALIEYFKETLGQEFANGSSKNFDVIKSYKISEYMILDANSRRNLELFQTLSGQNQGSFFAAIDRTASKPGKRKLKSWIEQPLLNIEEINKRQNAIEELLEDRFLISKLHNKLSELYDLDRLSNRLVSTLISPRELIQLKNSLLTSIELSLDLQNSKHFGQLRAIDPEIKNLVAEIESALIDTPPILISEGNIIKAGYNNELDEYISLVTDSQSWLENYESQEKERTGIKTLKVSFNKVHGYYIESSRLNQSKLPEDYIIKQTMVNTIRAVTPELQDFEDKITNAESRRNNLEYKIFNDLRQKLAMTGSKVKKLAQDLATLDALVSLAKLADEQNYTKPSIDNSFNLELKDARHPVVEQKLKLGEFVPNDINIGKDFTLMILTGPNMAGKSTYMRQNALIVLLAQIGSYVPASYARIGLVDRIFTRIGASDDLASGQSTFMVEMTETASILNGMTNRSFVVLDEIGRGTSTYDGVSIAWAIVEHIVKNYDSRTIFATHYHELAGLQDSYKKIQNFQVLVSESKDQNGKNQIEFLHKVTTGSADKSYGIEVARLAGLPKGVLDRARAINSQLAGGRSRVLAKKNPIEQNSSSDIESLPLFTAN
ncbi:MAG: DNA mismatch repair protein MutS [Candidatus Caenarcaniphilales bacterium]|nr:DNA mismatch repair protein MutS [Candidatus Caenarcaniphilales bacterium]